jgi:hypothetical protein
MCKKYYIQTFAFSQYDIRFADNTPPRIMDALRIQPGSSSGITEYSIVVQDVEALDYDTGAFWYHNVDGIDIPKSYEFDVS